MAQLKFKGIEAPEWLIINDIRFPILPGVSQKTVKVNGRAGLLDFGNEIAERVIEVDVTLLASSRLEMRQRSKQVAEWLYSEEEEILIHPEDTSKYVLAKVTGGVSLQEVLNVGQGTITFVCTDPYIYDTVTKVETLQHGVGNSSRYIDNTGSVDTYPVYTMVFAQDTNMITMSSRTDDDSEYIRIGNPVQIDTQVVLDTNPLKMQDNMASTSTWTTTPAPLEGALAVVSDPDPDYGYYITAGSYGADNSGWHGAGGYRNIMTNASTLQDFSMTALVGFNCATGQEDRMGKLEIEVLGSDDTVLARMAIYDASDVREYPRVACTLNPNSSTGKVKLADTEGGYAGALRLWNTGQLRILRKGKLWKFYYRKNMPTDADEIANQRTYSWTDNSSTGSTLSPVQKIRIAFYQYQNKPVMDKIYISDIKVWDESPPAVSPDTYEELLFKTGDRLVIDSNTGKITKNGFPFYEHVEHGSVFPRLYKEFSYLSTYPQSALDFTIQPDGSTASNVKWKERWI